MGALALAVLLLAGAWRLATQAAPALVIHRTLPAYVRLAGASPALAWPGEGAAAVAVEGVGSFGASGSAAPVPIASLAKVMTAFLTLRAHPLAAGAGGFVMVVSPAEAAEQRERVELGQSTVPVSAGERISERQALQALLLPSANNIAAMLALQDAGGLAAFVAQMNTVAKSLGMSSTTYTDPSGFDASTVSTASDQLKLARAAMRDPAFAAIVDQSSAELPLGAVANYDTLVGRRRLCRHQDGLRPRGRGLLHVRQAHRRGGPGAARAGGGARSARRLADRSRPRERPEPGRLGG